MEIDRILHEKKNFLELNNDDIENFLKTREFNNEHLGLEFKSNFPKFKSGKFNFKKICSYIVGFSNSEGGLIVYGVNNIIRNKKVNFPDYIDGFSSHPSIEDLDVWAKDFICPRIQSTAIRFFKAAGKKIAIIKIPAGVNKPYCYITPSNGGKMTFFAKTAAGLTILKPDQVRNFFRETIIEQSKMVVRAAKVNGRESNNNAIGVHQSFILPKLEDYKNFGHIAIYCYPNDDLNIPIDDLKNFVVEHRYDFSEAMRFYPRVEFFQNGIFVGYYPRSIREDIKSTERITFYKNGFVAFDSQVDFLMDRDGRFHQYWFSYELQRQLQLSKAILEKYGVEKITIFVDLKFIEKFFMKSEEPYSKGILPYSGSHKPIIKDNVNLSEINSFDNKEKKNVVSPLVKEIMDEVSRIFGASKTLSGVWDENGYLTYVKGLEHLR